MFHIKPTHFEPAPNKLYHISSALSVQPPWNPAHVLYLLPRTIPFCIDLPPCTACWQPLRNVHSCLRPRPLSCRSFLNSLLRLQTRAVITRYSSLNASPRSLLHVIHISTIDTTRIQSLCTILLVLISLSLFCLDFRCPPYQIHPFTSCRNIHVSFTCIPYIASKPRSASKSASTLIAERTSHHYISWTPFPLLCFVRVRFVVAIFVTWDLSVGNGRT